MILKHLFKRSSWRKPLLLLSCILSLCIAHHVCVAATASSNAVNSGMGSQSSKVTDSTGKPLSGVRIFLQQRPWLPIPGEIVQTTPTLSNAQGGFEKPELQSPDAFLVFEKEGYATRALRAADELPEEIAMQPGVPIFGSIVDDKGTSLSGVTVGPVMLQGISSHIGSNRTPLLIGTSDEKGNFRLPDVGRGRYDILIHAKNKIPKLVDVMAGTEKLIMLESGGTTVSGTVRGSRDNLPKPAIYVEALSPGMRLFSKTDDAGVYVFSNLPQREWKFRAASDSTDHPHPAVTLQIGSKPETRDADLMLIQGVTIAGKVLNEDTSQPITQMELRLDTDPPRKATSDNSGNFMFDNVDAFGDLALRFDATKYSYESNGNPYEYYNLAIGSGSDLTTVTLLLKPRIVVEGKVTDTIGRGIQGAVVTARSLATGLVRVGKKLQGVELNTRSKALGDFAIGVFPAGRYEFWAAKDNLISRAEQVDAYATSSASVILKLEAAQELTGKITDASDAIVTGAAVVIYPGSQEGQLDENRAFKRVTNQNDGRFRIMGLPAGRFTIVASHPDYVTTTRGEVDLSDPTSNSITLRFPPGSTFTGQVIDKASRRPVADAEVKLYYTNGLTQQVATRNSAQLGEVVFKGIPVSQADRITVDAAGYNIYEKSNVTLSGSQNEIEIARRSSINVSLEQPETVEEPQKPTVYLLGASVGEELADAAPPADQFTVRDQSTPQQNKVKFSDVQPGWYKVAAQSKAGYAESDTFSIKESDSHDVTLKLAEAGSLHGRVIDKKTRAGVGGAAVKIQIAVSGLSEAAPESALTADDGSFTIENAPAGAVKLTAIHEKYPEHNEEINIQSGKPTDIVVEMSDETSRLTGSVTYGGTPLADALMVLYKERSETPTANAVSDASGNYEITGIPPGKYLLTVEAPIGNSERAGQKSFNVDISGESVTKDIAFEKLTTVVGHVRARNSSTEVKNTVLLFSPIGFSAAPQTVQIDPSGNYRAEMEPGKYSVGLEDRPGHEVTVPASDHEARLDLEF